MKRNIKFALAFLVILGAVWWSFSGMKNSNTDQETYISESGTQKNFYQMTGDTAKESEQVAETLPQPTCGTLKHWTSEQELKNDLEKNRSLMLMWATWRGTHEGKKISWQFLLRPPRYIIHDSIFFYIDETMGSHKQDSIPSPFTSPVGQSIFDRIELMNKNFLDSKWQFAITNAPEDKSPVSMMWEKDVGFTSCEQLK
jgi:hypothetical protein